MIVRSSRLVILAFAALSAGVAGNLLLMQSPLPGSGGRVLADRTTQKLAQERGRKLAIDQAAEAITVTPALPAPAPAAPASIVAAVQPPSGAHETTAAVQRLLLARGYEPGATDGVQGLVTRAAVMAFEHDHGLALTGEASELLLRALQNGPASISAAGYAAAAKEKRARAEQVVRTVQQSLSGLGYGAGKPTGRLNDETERAIREFEIDQRLPETGRISGQLVGRLARAAGNGRIAAGR